MSFRLFSVTSLALAMLVGTTALATKDAKQSSHDGKVVSITGDQLVMTSKKGQEHSHTLTAEAKLTLDGKNCKAEALKAGTRIRVTTQGADTNVATRIEGLDKNLWFANNRHDGKVVSITEDMLVMTSKEGKKHSHTLTGDAKLTLDGKTCKPAVLKSGTRIRVTTTDADGNEVSRIEALDKNPEFAIDYQDGKVVSITGNELVMMVTKGKEEQTRTLTDDVEVTCDGKVCESSGLKPGMRIRVTPESDDPDSAVRIEALDVNPEFATL